MTISDERLMAFCQRNHINLLVTLDAFIADTRALLAEAVAQEREAILNLKPLTHDPYTHAWEQAIRSRSQPQTKEDERG